MKVFHFHEMPLKPYFMKFSERKVSQRALAFNLEIFKAICARLALGNQRFPVRVRLMDMCRGGLSAVIALLMSKCL